MDSNNQRNRDTLTTDAGKLNQHAALPPIVISPPETESQESIVPKIKKSTPDEFDKKSNTYVEPDDAYPDELEYSRNGKDQGIVIIFNQVRFLYENKRLGSTKDVNDIIFTLGRLGYNIDEKYIFSNLATEEIWKKVEEISQEDLSNKNSLILFFLTHGMEKDTLMTRDNTINTKQIWDVLGRHKDLKNKPKFFIFQACKGESLSTPFEKEQTENEIEGHAISYVSLSSYQTIPPDILLCYSSAEGMKSYRDIEKGSWLIQEICKNFLMYGRRDDVISLLTRVTKCVSTYTFRDTKQMPVLISTLSKKFYLCKTKDRTNKLAIYQLYEKLHIGLKEINTEIDNLEKLHDSRK